MYVCVSLRVSLYSHCIPHRFFVVAVFVGFVFLCVSEFDNDAKIETENTDENETANGTCRLRRHRCNKDKIQ